MTDELAQIREGVTVRPGDTLVLRVGMDGRDVGDVQDEISEIHAYLTSRMPAGARVVVLAMEDGQLSVVRAGETPDTLNHPGSDRWTGGDRKDEP